jgi:hypothetical protein
LVVKFMVRSPCSINFGILVVTSNWITIMPIIVPIVDG